MAKKVNKTRFEKLEDALDRMNIQDDEILRMSIALSKVILQQKPERKRLLSAAVLYYAIPNIFSKLHLTPFEPLETQQQIEAKIDEYIQ